MRAAVFALFLLSGAAALGFELAASRWLHVLFGASHAAAGALLAAFMSGLALGGALGASLAPKLSKPLYGYAACELTIAGWSLLVLRLFPAVTTLAAAQHTAGRVALAFALLAPATLAMGATTPLLAQAIAPQRAQLQLQLAHLYASNLAGATAGALCTGFLLLPRIGLHHTVQTIAALAALVGTIAFFTANRFSAEANEEPSTEEVSTQQGTQAWFALASLTIAGTLSFALQVCFQRIFALLLGSSAYTFALVTAVTLAALSLGGARSSFEEDETTVWHRASSRVIFFTITAYLSLLVAHIVPPYLRAAVVHGEHLGLSRAGLVALLVAGPMYQIGALFPTLAARSPGATSGRTTGLATLSSTIGNATGALVAGFVLIPKLGVPTALSLVCGTGLLLALLLSWQAGRQRLRGTAVSAVLALWFATVLAPRWDPVAMSAGSYRAETNRAMAQTQTEANTCGPRTRFRNHRVLFARDGATGTVVVLGHPAGPQCSLYSLRVNGKAEGSVFVRGPLRDRVQPEDERLAVGDLPGELLAGWLPARVGARAQRAFLVGWGTGYSARALLAGGVQQLDAAELEPAVLAAAEHFDAELLRDSRVHIAVDDARMALRLAPEGHYDVIVSHPSNPWVVGASALFSREYFQLLRSRLAPGGRALAWVQLYEIDRVSVQSLLATFREVFPSAHALRPAPGARELFLLGFRENEVMDLPALQQRVGNSITEQERPVLQGIGSIVPAQLLAERYAASPAALERFTRGVAVNTDDAAALEYRVADRLLRGTGESVEELLRGL